MALLAGTGYKHRSELWLVAECVQEAPRTRFGKVVPKSNWFVSACTLICLLSHTASQVIYESSHLRAIPASA